MITILKSNITNATITDTSELIDIDDSCQIDEDLMFAAHILNYEMVQIINKSTGARFTTMATTSCRPGKICLNGSATLLGGIGDKLEIRTYEQVSASSVNEEHTPIFVDLDEKNHIKKTS